MDHSPTRGSFTTLNMMISYSDARASVGRTLGEQSDTTNRFELVCLYVSSSVVVCHADIFAKGNVEQQIAVGMMAKIEWPWIYHGLT